MTFDFTESQKNALSRAVVFQFLSFEGIYMRVVNTDIVHAANLSDRCCELARIYAELNHGMQLFCQSDSLRNIMYPKVG